MSNHAAILRQIRQEARPYVEQALELAEVFIGFRKLATENGLDWGVIKALIKAELQDEKEGGSIKVDRLIEKADFASAYADMLGLGAPQPRRATEEEAQEIIKHVEAKMNEKKYTCSIPDNGIGKQRFTVDHATGEIIDDPASGPPEAEAGTGGVTLNAPSSRPAIEAGQQSSLKPASSISEPVACSPSDGAAVESCPDSFPAASIPDLPSFLDRRVA